MSAQPSLGGQGGGRMSARTRWLVGLGFGTIGVAVAIWRVPLDSPALLFVVRLYQDHAFLHERLQALGWLAPAVFILLQAFQVIISPIPGEATGLLGGYLFGLPLGFIYSTVGLTVGTMAAFAIGRGLGAAVVARYVPQHVAERFRFIGRTEGAILVFIIYVIPGFPKDIVSYLFGISPVSARSFLLVSTLGRAPGTWVLSAQGASAATGNYVALALITAVTAMVAVPLYYSRHRVLDRVRHRAAAGGPRC